MCFFTHSCSSGWETHSDRPPFVKILQKEKIEKKQNEISVYCYFFKKIKLSVFIAKNKINQLERQKKLTLIDFNILHLPSSADLTALPSPLNSVALNALEWKKL